MWARAGSGYARRHAAPERRCGRPDGLVPRPLLLNRSPPRTRSGCRDWNREILLARRDQPRGCSMRPSRACRAALAGRRKERAGSAAEERPSHSQTISARPQRAPPTGPRRPRGFCISQMALQSGSPPDVFVCAALERRAVYLIHRDCRRKLLGKEPRAGRTGSPAKRGDAVREASCGNPTVTEPILAQWSVVRRSRCYGIAHSSRLPLNQNRLRHGVQRWSSSGLEGAVRFARPACRSLDTGSGTPMKPIPYDRHRFPAEVISHAAWLYFRFTLSLRDVEEMMAARGAASLSASGHVISSGRTNRSKVAASTSPSAIPASLSVMPSAWAYCAIFAALS